MAFEEIVQLIASGRKLEIRSNEQWLSIIVSDRKGNQVMRELAWRDLYRRGNVEQIFIDTLDLLYRDYKRHLVQQRQREDRRNR